MLTFCLCNWIQLNYCLTHQQTGNTFTYLADAFIQSNWYVFMLYIFLSVHVFPGNRTHNLCAANAMLYHWATGTQSGHPLSLSWAASYHEKCLGKHSSMCPLEYIFICGWCKIVSIHDAGDIWIKSTSWYCGWSGAQFSHHSEFIHLDLLKRFSLITADRGVGCGGVLEF